MLIAAEFSADTLEVLLDRGLTAPVSMTRSRMPM